MVVDAVKLDFSPVNKEDVSLNFHGFEPDALFYAGTFSLVINVIKRRFLRVPFFNSEIFKRDRSMIPVLPLLCRSHFAL